MTSFHYLLHHFTLNYPDQHYLHYPYSSHYQLHWLTHLTLEDLVSEFLALNYQYLFYHPQLIHHLSECQNLDSLECQPSHLLPNHHPLCREFLHQNLLRSILLHRFHFDHSLRSAPLKLLFHLFLLDLTRHYLLPNSHRSLHQVFKFAHHLPSNHPQFFNQNCLNQSPD